MKKFILLLFVAIGTFSCDLNDDSYSYHTEFVPVASADVPETMALGEEYQITLSYVKPNSCYSLVNMMYNKSTETINEGEENEYDREVRTIAVLTQVEERSDCEEINENEESWFTFVPATTGPYVFKFWQGEDENGDDLYLEFETEVTETAAP